MTVNIHHLELLMLVLLIFVVGLAVLARRIEQPYPIVFVLGGLVLSFLPPVPDIALHPDFVFLVVLPPLVFAAAHNSSWRDFRKNLTRFWMLRTGCLYQWWAWGLLRISYSHSSLCRQGWCWEP